MGQSCIYKPRDAKSECNIKVQTHTLQVAAAALAAVSEDDARAAMLRGAVALARNRLSNAWSPGYEASCVSFKYYKAAGYAFFPITLNEFGGHGTGGSEWLRVIAHECDGAMLGKKYDLGERFYHEHQTFVSMNSRSWIVQTVGVGKSRKSARRR